MRYLIIMAATGMALLSSGARAHHSATAYDLHKVQSLHGVLKELRFENPHVNMLLEVRLPNGQLSGYRIEGNPPGWFRQVGIRKADFDKGVGQPVTVEVHPSKDGSAIGYFQKIIFADGTFLRFADVTQ